MSTPSGGRRVATRRRPRPSRRPTGGGAVGAVLVLLAAGLLVLGGMVDAPPEAAPEPAAVPVGEVTTACLGWPDAAAGQSSTLAAPLPPADAPDDGGELSVGPVGKPGAPEKAGSRGEVRELGSPGAGEGLVVTATGDAAVGRATFQVDRADGSGFALQQCPEPRAQWSFTGGGAGLDHQSKLVLANVDPGPAVVDVVVQGPSGVAEDVGTRGVTVAPGEVRTIDMVDVAPQSDELLVRVDATRGRVVAGLADSFATQPAAEPGWDWVPAQPEASRTLRLAPVPRLADRRDLVLANPTDREALVEVRVSGQSGAFAPTGLEEVRVPARSVVSEDLGQAIGRDTSAVVLRSPVPVTAAVRSSRGPDVSYAGAVAFLDGPAAAVVEQNADAEVQLTAGDGDAQVRVAAYSTSGKEVDSDELKVPATATAGWTPKGRVAYVVVTPVRGRVAGGVSVVGGGGVSEVPLQALPVTLERPVVVPVVR